MKILILLLIYVVNSYAGHFSKVRITPEISYIYVYHKGKAVKVHRIQNTKNKLTGEYAMTYRPNKDIQPIKVDNDVTTIGEVELLYFMKNRVNKKRGVLVDLRTKQEYKEESIPSAVNIPSKIITNKVKVEKILKVLGAKRLPDGTLDTSRVMDVTFYCNGLWCDKTSNFIKKFLELGYPADKILYYRGGFQMWKILGFTTVTN
ncbi:MAG: rhodanese-like domain-containing protein [Campylobacterota bacterium]|nr:rhodanese-like domain-containing protein [Campylobacterota bacterium]